MEEITDNKRLYNILGGNVVDVGCAIWGGVLLQTGGAAGANPVGLFATGFCTGYVFARLFG